MQLAIRTLKGDKFTVEAELSNTIAEVKSIIEKQKAELPAANLKLIHSGKVLKDDDTIESCNLKPNAFLVVMVTKPKKAATPAPAPAQAPKETPAPASTTATTTPAPAPAANTSTTTTAPAPPPTTTTTTTTAETTSTSTPTPAAAPASSSSTDSFPPETVSNLTAMGFPDAEVRACLRAAQGNPNVAVEYLMNGIPAYAQQIANATTSAPAPASSSGTGGAGSSSEPLAALRSHPQINQLRQLVQSNPGTLQAVLAQIGQQQPELLQEINSNQELFIQIMNEPVGTGTGVSSSAPSSSPAPSATSSPAAANPSALMQGMNNPGQMAQMIQSMRPEQLQGLAAMMGMTPEQLSQTAQMLGQMPQEDFQNMMNAAMMGGGGDLAGLMGGAGGQGGVPPGAQVVRLTEEEMAAVDRLTEMGFDRNEAVQAYLACDKNEALAANLLMDGGWGGDMDMGGNSGGNDGDDNMYD